MEVADSAETPRSHGGMGAAPAPGRGGVTAAGAAGAVDEPPSVDGLVLDPAEPGTDGIDRRHGAARSLAGGRYFVKRVRSTESAIFW